MDREERSRIAYRHLNEMAEMYSRETEDSAKRSVVYDSTVIKKPVVRLEDCTTSDALKFYPDKQVCILNFADYTLPGGRFLKGFGGQEEALCHDSNLFDILGHFKHHYNKNNNKRNYGMYHDFAIWSPDVQFVRPIKKKVNVITCPAPNFKEFKRNINEFTGKNSGGKRLAKQADYMEQYDSALVSRCGYVLDVAKKHNEKILILGAFGCGVFENSALTVASIFRNLLQTGTYEFDEVMFAIPKSDKNDNYDKFRLMFHDILKK